MCDFCEGKRTESICGCLSMTYKQEDTCLSFEYNAYSIDSSFDGSQVWITIKYCPMCGQKLSCPKTSSQSKTV
jgi:hypothetical protein